MRFTTPLRSVISACLLLAYSYVNAADAPIEFSAEVVQTDAQGRAMHGKLYASQEKMRSEFEQSGQRMVQIIDPTQRVAYILLPDQKTYLAQQQAVQPAASAAITPCAGMPPSVQCTKLGGETLQNRPVEKYEITGVQDGKTVRSTQWFDIERHIPLKIEFSDGSKMELRFIGLENLQGRSVEKWETVQTTPNAPARSLFQWYDPGLRLAIKEEIPGGMVRELRNIQVAPQDAQLFKLPAGYQPMAQPTPAGTPLPGTKPTAIP